MARLPYRPTRASGKGRGPRVTREQRDAAVAPTKHGKVTSHLDTSRRMAEERAMGGPAYASATRPKGNPNPIIVSGWLIGTDGGTVFGYRAGAFGDLDPDSAFGLTVVEITVDTATGAVVLILQSGKANADAISINADNNTTVVYWNGTDRYETTDSAFATAIAAELDNQIPVAFTNSGYAALSWNTIPNQVFRTNVPRSVDFRTFLNGTSKATATITEGDTWPAGFTYTNGLLEWDGTGNVNAGSEQSNIASDGLGPDIESALFTYTVEAYTALSWDTIPDNVFPSGTPGSFDLRTFLNGTNAATAAISLNQQLPPGLSFSNGVISYSGSGNPSVTGLVATAGDGTGPNAVSNAFGVSTDFAALSWATIPSQNWVVGEPQSLDLRQYLQGDQNEIDAALIVANSPIPPGNSLNSGVWNYWGTDPFIWTGSFNATGPVTTPPGIDSNNLTIQTSIDLVSQLFDIGATGGNLDSRNPGGAVPGVFSLPASLQVVEGGQRSVSCSRTGGLAGAVAVDWTITGPNVGDITPPTSGTLNFADGEGSKPIVFTVGTIGSQGSITITLSNPTNGATINPSADAVAVTITVQAAGEVYAEDFSIAQVGQYTDGQLIPGTDLFSRTWWGSGQVYIVDGEGRGGSRALRCRYPQAYDPSQGNTGRECAGRLRPFDAIPSWSSIGLDFQLSWWFRREAAAQFLCRQNKVVRMYFGSPTADAFQFSWTLQLDSVQAPGWGTGKMYSQFTDGGVDTGTPSADINPSATPGLVGQWNKLTFKWKAASSPDAADGKYELWLNEGVGGVTPQRVGQNLAYRAPWDGSGLKRVYTPNSIQIGYQINLTSSTAPAGDYEENRYVDDIQIIAGSGL